MSNLARFFILLFFIFSIVFYPTMAQSDASKIEKGKKISDSLWHVYNSAQKLDVEDTTQINRLLDIAEY